MSISSASTGAERRRVRACAGPRPTSAGGSSGGSSTQTRRTFRPAVPKRCRHFVFHCILPISDRAGHRVARDVDGLGCRKQSARDLRRKLLQQRLRLLQIARVESLCEPPVYRSQQFARLLRLPLVTPEARHAHRCAEFPRFGLLSARHYKRMVEVRLFLASGARIAISPATRCISASYQLSLLVFVAATALSILRLASSNNPTSASALPKYDKYIGNRTVVPVGCHSDKADLIIRTLSEACPIVAKRQPLITVPPIFQKKVPLSSASATSSSSWAFAIAKFPQCR
jgi:hypothetical protein